MASIAPFPPPTPPRPQQHFAHMAPHASPLRQDLAGQQHIYPSPSSYGHGYSMNFDSQDQNGQPAYAQSFPGSQQYASGPPSAAGYSKSFGEGYPTDHRVYAGKPQIYTVRNMTRFASVEKCGADSY